MKQIIISIILGLTLCSLVYTSYQLDQIIGDEQSEYIQGIHSLHNLVGEEERDLLYLEIEEHAKKIDELNTVDQTLYISIFLFMTGLYLQTPKRKANVGGEQDSLPGR